LDDIYLEMPEIVDYISENLIDENNNKLKQINKKYLKAAEHIIKIYN